MALPPSSPRLPSPPPPAEIQIGPQSPAGAGGSLSRQQQMEQQMDQTVLDANAKRRIHPGTRAADFAVGPPLVPLNELDSAFQLQEHLAALHYFHTANNTIPITRETARTLAHAPPGTDRTLWLYELCRFLIAQCNSLIVGFLFDTPPCSAATCPEMRASEWQFLCAVHEQPKSCCAIDYCCHTLDWAANVVTNPKIFPSRFVFADPHDKSAAVKNLINVFRRLHRIFAHAWFQHRGVFWAVEGQTGLYVLFKTVCDMYDLLPAENYKLPPEAEGLVEASSVAAAVTGASRNSAENGASGNGNSNNGVSENAPGVISIASLNDRKAMGYGPSPGPIPASGAAGSSNSSNGHGRRGGSGSGNGLGMSSDFLGTGADDEHSQAVGRTNTRRHIRSSPSTGSAVTTVIEQDEEPTTAAASTASSGFGGSSTNSSNTNTSRIIPPSPVVLTPASHVATAPSVTVQEHRGDSPEPAAGVVEVPVIVHHEEPEPQQADEPEIEATSADTSADTAEETGAAAEKKAGAASEPPGAGGDPADATKADANDADAAAEKTDAEAESAATAALAEAAESASSKDGAGAGAGEQKAKDDAAPVTTKEDDTSASSEAEADKKS